MRFLIPIFSCLPLVLSHSPIDTCNFNWPFILSSNFTQSPVPSFKTLGTPETHQEPSAELVRILSQISLSRINNTISTLVSFGTRSTLSDKVSNATYGVGGARDRIAEEMSSYIESSGGKLNVSVLSYIQPPATNIPVATNISDVVGILTGSTDPGRI
jgi:hypothetical protein